MANKYKGEVQFKAGGETFILRFSADAIVAIEEAFEKTIKQFGEMLSDADNLKMSTVKRCFCIGIVDHYREERPEIDEAKAAVIFGRLGPKEVMELISTAFNAAFESEGAQAPAAANPPQKPANPKGGAGPAS